MTTATRVVLTSRPEAMPSADNFTIETEPLEKLLETSLPEGGLLVKTLVMSLDPYMRARMANRTSYAPPTPLGEVLPAEAVVEVVHSNAPEFSSGDQLLAFTGWQEYAIVQAENVRPLPEVAVEPSHALGILGMPGITAYSGLLEHGKPQAGETLVVAAATGPVGSTVGQIARILGLRVVGIASGPDKCATLTGTLGFDAAVDRNSPRFAEELAAAVPDGIDIYFETVGGQVFETILPLLNRGARVPVCGLVSQWLPTDSINRPYATDLLRAMLDRSLSFTGFVVHDLADQYREAFFRDMQTWISEGRFHVLETVTEGIENTPDAFIRMLTGASLGKSLVKVA